MPQVDMREAVAAYSASDAPGTSACVPLSQQATLA